MLEKAIRIAATAHAGQFDKGGMPYILHPLKVMHYLKSKDLELMAIAVLHDVVEDTDITLDFLVNDAKLSYRIIKGVDALTKLKGEDYNAYKERIKSNPDAVKVKMADLRHNTDIRRLKGIEDKDIARVAKYHEFYMELKGLV